MLLYRSAECIREIKSNNHAATIRDMRSSGSQDTPLREDRREGREKMEFVTATEFDSRTIRDRRSGLSSVTNENR